MSTPDRKRAAQLCHIILLKAYYASPNALGQAKVVALSGGRAPSLQVAGGDDGVSPHDALLPWRLDNSVKLVELDKLVGHLGGDHAEISKD